MPRVSVYLDEREQEAAAELADKEGLSFSWVMRVALRLFLGLPVPRGYDPNREPRE